MIYYISDLHFGHKNVIHFDSRPFADTGVMEEVMIRNWNEKVTDEDTVYVLGDAFWKNEENSISIRYTAARCSRVRRLLTSCTCLKNTETSYSHFASGNH